MTKSITLTTQDLRDMVQDLITPTIDIHRASRVALDSPQYIKASGSPTDEEIDDFVFSNILLDDDLALRLTDPGLLGFQANTATTSQEWVDEFKSHIKDWTENNAWLAADSPMREFFVTVEQQSQEIWRPGQVTPGWLSNSASYLMLAADTIIRGGALNELEWRDLEKLLGDLLQEEGWDVQVTRATKDGGVDVVAIKKDAVLGDIKSVWQAKKYSATRKVRLHEVRELSAVREDTGASKAFMVTTSKLTKDAIDYVTKDLYRLGYKDREDLENWVMRNILGLH